MSLTTCAWCPIARRCIFAAKEGVSINQFIASATLEKLAAISTQEYLEARANRGSREKFEAALAQVPDAEPDPPDRQGSVPNRLLERTGNRRFVDEIERVPGRRIELRPRGRPTRLRVDGE